MDENLEEDAVVQIRSLPEEAGDGVSEVRINCPDATGLGCDVTRLLLDFGLRILEGDISTDGKWCFLIFKVALTSRVTAHWSLLKQRLEALCPQPGPQHRLWRWPSSAPTPPTPFLLQVSSYDRVGVLHDLINTLWECDVTVFKAHITTSPAQEVLDMFWFYDNRGELPSFARELEITDQVRTCCCGGPSDARCEVGIVPADPDSCADDERAAAGLATRQACKDASPASPLRRMVSIKRRNGGTALVATEKDEWGDLQECEVKVDNSTAQAYTVVQISCRDRKGLMYDLMRTLKDIHIRVAYGKVLVRDDATCAIDLFVQEVDSGTRILAKELQEELVERVRVAVTLPVRISIKDVFDETCTELLVSASLDSGGRGRPRVTFDVTAALNALGICVFMADVYIEPLVQVGEGRRPMELHRFLVHFHDGTRLETPEEKRAVYECVHATLMGADIVLGTPPSPSSRPQSPLVGGSESGSAGAIPRDPSRRPASPAAGGGGALRQAGQHQNGHSKSLMNKVGHSLSSWKWSSGKARA